jgi:hypothetical protein
MEAICSSETSVDTQRTTRRYIPEDSTLLFIYGLLQDAINSPAYTVSNGGISELQSMWKKAVVAYFKVLILGEDDRPPGREDNPGLPQ